jgi:hypothetical protein
MHPKDFIVAVKESDSAKTKDPQDASRQATHQWREDVF